METLSRRREHMLWAPALGLCSAIAVLIPEWQTKALMLCPLLLAAIWWLILRPSRWLVLFFVCLLLTPPLPGPAGDAGIHVAPAIALIGVVAGLLRMSEWRATLSPISLAFGCFLAILLVSSAIAGIYSGESIALGSISRVGLFGIGVYVFLYASEGPDDSGIGARKFAAFLFFIGCAAALFACLDFYFQFPAPARFEAQYVWLDTGVFRRAQGLFYDASTLGNFCAFFLVMVAVALFRREDSPCFRLFLLGGGAVFAVAMILSYSRGSIVNLLVALLVLLVMRGRGRLRFWKSLPIGVIAMICAVIAVRFALPSFSASYWDRIGNSMTYFWYSPDGVLSGRVNNWYTLTSAILREPWHAVLGVGYKTLAYSNLFGEPIVTDNTYLSVLVETGVAGFTSFVVLNGLILRYAWRAAKSANGSTGFFGEWIFCFWAGEMVQMLSGDLITYWRVLPVYFCVLGIAVRRTDGRP